MERRTKIVATIGPASREPEVLVRMVEAGMDVARLNFSHGTAELHAETAQRVRNAMEESEQQISPELTPEQQKKLQKLKQEHHRILMHHGFAPPPPDGPPPLE